jgi:diguanylate cyclase (GGDEF)-like protein
MGKLLYTWRYYSFGKDQYIECMNKVFISNLSSLRQANTLVAIFLACFALFPVFYARNYLTAAVCFAAAFIAFMFSIYLNYKIQTTIVTNRFIYVFSALFYLNMMLSGIYLGLGIMSTPDKLITIYFCFLICGLLMFINPAIYNLILTLTAMVVFSLCAIFFKSADNAIYDIVDTLIAGIFSLFFSWHITKLRMGLELSTNMLEEERNKYLNQSTIDELTQLNNRRDFMKTFQRYQSNYRNSDDYLCVSIADIDFFKNYNDHYGHPQGDTCLRSVGAAFAKLKDIMGVYAARVGGEEFAILWFEKEASHVDEVVKCMSGLIKDMKMPHAKSKVNEFVTMSMGVYVERVGEPSDIQTLYDLADKALYNAKGGGRNCAVINGRDIKEYKITPDS